MEDDAEENLADPVGERDKDGGRLGSGNVGGGFDGLTLILGAVPEPPLELGNPLEMGAEVAEGEYPRYEPAEPRGETLPEADPGGIGLDVPLPFNREPFIIPGLRPLGLLERLTLPADGACPLRDIPEPEKLEMLEAKEKLDAIESCGFGCG